MKKVKKVICFVLVFTTLLLCSNSAFAYTEINLNGAGVSTYNKCGYGNRAGARYVDNVLLGIKESFVGYPVWDGFINNLQNDNASRQYILNANKIDATLFVYAGHGITFDSGSNAWHINKNTNNSSHSTLGERTSTQINVRTTDLASTKHRYMVAYTCNFLTNGGTQLKMYNMHKIGARVLCGFASTMYLHSEEGWDFGRRTRYESVKSSFLNAAKRYQPYIGAGNKVIARVQGLKGSTIEKIDANASLAPSYTSNKSLYGIIETAEIFGQNNYQV